MTNHFYRVLRETPGSARRVILAARWFLYTFVGETDGFSSTQQYLFWQLQSKAVRARSRPFLGSPQKPILLSGMLLAPLVWQGKP